jgi:hypothetical protein
MMLKNGGDMQEQFGLGEMIQNLLKIDDEVWGLYAFSRDILKERVPINKRLEMIKKAVTCGREYAEYVTHEHGSSDVNVIAERLKLKVRLQDGRIIGKRILFACYTPPDEIEIMTEPVEKAAQQRLKNEPTLVEYFEKNSIMNTILGHEIFHYIEDKFEQKIYTRTEKILLWNFMGLKNFSTIRALGEIGAMV